LQTAYKFPIADVIDGSLTVVPDAVRNALSRLSQADIPKQDETRMRAILDKLMGRIHEQANERMPMQARGDRQAPMRDRRAKAAMATLNLARAVTHGTLDTMGFNKNQRRGPDGKWIKMGGPGSAGGSPKLPGGRRSEGGGAGAGGRENSGGYNPDDVPTGNYDYSPDASPAQKRRVYNVQLVEEAEAFQDANRDEDDYDPELEAQIETIHGLMEEKKAQNGREIDAAVDHLRGMLAGSYADDDELPAVPNASGGGGESNNIQMTVSRSSRDALADAMADVPDALDEPYVADAEEVIRQLRGKKDLDLTPDQRDFLQEQVQGLNEYVYEEDDPGLARAIKEMWSELVKSYD
jgi:hypothetical protein